jgi:hypothetical protein
VARKEKRRENITEKGKRKGMIKEKRKAGEDRKKQEREMRESFSSVVTYSNLFQSLSKWITLICVSVARY